MSTVISTNINSLFVRRELAGVQSSLADSVERLSSGVRINRAKDDVAGLGISEVLRSQVTAINQGIRNANDAVSIVQAAEGSLTEASSILLRMKELATQARNATLSKTQRQFISNEISNLRKEINAIAERTTFNDLSLLKNALRTEPLQVLQGPANALQNGATLANGLRVADLKVDGANSGSYRLTTGVVEEIMTPLSYVTAKSDPTEGRIPNPPPPQFTNNDFEDISAFTTTTQIAVVEPGSSSVNAQVTSITGWKIYHHQVKLGITPIGGWTSPNAADTPTSGSLPRNGDDNTPMSATYTSAFTVASVTLGKSAELNSDMQTLAGGDVVHGPYMISDSTVDLQGGDSVSFKWQAQGGSDNYDIYAYLLNVDNGNTIELVRSSGTSSAFSTVSKNIAAGQDGNYKFVFVSGTHDLSGGRAAGARLYVDDVNITFSARPGQTQVYVGGPSTGKTLTISGEWEPGDEINYTVKGNTSTVTSFTYVVAAENFTTNNDGTGGAIDPDSDLARQNIAASIAAQYASLTNVTPTASAASGIVTFAGASVTLTAEQLNRPLRQRDITFANEDIAAGNQITLSIADKKYTVVVGTDMSSSDVANAFKTKVLADYPGTATVAASVLTLQPGSQTSNSDISLSVSRPSDLALVQNIASAISDPSEIELTSRTITINDADVVAGREFVVLVGNPETSTEYRVVAGTGDTASSIAQKLENKLDDNFGSAVGGSVGSTLTGNVITLTAATGLGMANLELQISEVAGQDAISSVSTVNAKTRDDRARSISVNQSDIIAGAMFAVSIAGKEYAVQMDSSDTAESVADQLAGLLKVDFPNDRSATRITSAGNRVTLTASALVGLDDIDISVKKLGNPNVITLIALDDTGQGGLSQTISLGDIASGGSTEARFDRLGVSFSVANDGSGTFSQSSNFIKADNAQVLTVGPSDPGRALVQVGVDTRANFIATSFRDIRLTGYNQNQASEAGVFNRLSAALDIMALNTDSALADQTFLSLENLTEDVITTLNGFRVTLGVQQNRLEYAISSLQNQSAQLTSTKSKILDTEYASETARLTRMQIGQQAATAMLAQANQLPNVILSLIS